MVSSNNKIVSSRFFEQSQFEQMIMTQPANERFVGGASQKVFNDVNYN